MLITIILMSSAIWIDYKAFDCTIIASKLEVGIAPWEAIENISFVFPYPLNK